ncbi:hypothetical protein E3J38_00490 [candidate division TA06 bacterium]|uniref:Uncharacterized protein n=1 Tax=candidate division TA06 bacterium TaxID=2250710 RepID=A0A523XW07_UNCT6|nr:MAG: hypothetical protein E3J38_00490 [candidate division TA06 bacterium]
MAKRKSKLLGFLLLAGFILGCGGSTSERSLVEMTNRDNKRFRGVWVYKSRMPGQVEFSEGTRIDIAIDRRKFHLVAKWGAAYPAKRGQTEEWIHNGKFLWELAPLLKQANWLEIKGLRRGPFWKMPYQMAPFGPVKNIGEEDVAGRACKVLRTRGRYDQGDVTLTYWIDEERGVLLKKEHLLEAGGILLVHEIYECEDIEFDPGFSAGMFEVNIPSDWVKVEKLHVDSELLDTKF